MDILYDKDANLEVLKDKTIGIIGYGSQGYAHSNNLKDSGMKVIVGLREEGPSWRKAEEAGLEVKTIQETARSAQILMILVPDEVQKDLYEKEIAFHLKKGNYLGFAHGFNIHYGQIQPPEWVSVFMVAPKGPGHLVRREYLRGGGVPALIAVHQDYTGMTKDIALAYGCAIGGGKAGIIETTFREETETDLFGEQTVLCGGVSALIMAGFETLVEAGYPPELCYFECLHELKLIVDLIQEGGITKMRNSISNTAQYGDLTRGSRVIGESSRWAMKEILEEVQSGSFAKEWILENRVGRPVFNALTKRGEEHPVEEVGKELRKMMKWLEKKD